MNQWKMTDEERAELTEKSNALRIKLKKWEKEFASANNGHKASREDIKANPDIAAKYKEYNKARDILSGKVPFAPPGPTLPKLPSHRQTPRKRKYEDDPVNAVSKRLQLQVNKTPSKGIHRTPAKSSLQPWEVDPYDSPSLIRHLFTPSKKAIGPTPQKDGVVLGLFDLLQDDGSTPSNPQEARTKGSIQATPRKVMNEVSLKHSRTPASAGKRYLLDSFATPLKTKTLNGQGGKTPSSISKLHFSTPSFLRRDSQRPLPPATENDETLELSPQMVRVPRKPLVRGLSSMLAGLRRLEEEAADEDLDALREMEAEEAGGSKPVGPKKMATVPEILVEDSQQGLLKLGGFDDEAMLDSEPEEEKGRDGQPLKVYKKKGQKRTTRRVKMKPTRSKPASQPPPVAEHNSEDELATQNLDTVPETHIAGEEDGISGFGEGRNFDSDSQSEYTASDGGTRYRRPNQAKKNKGANKEGRVKTAARKITAMANQNFKRLKLRNSGAKGGPAHNSRFRRKR